MFYFQTSVVFTLEEGPGVLFKALAVFALRDINLTKVKFMQEFGLFIYLFSGVCSLYQYASIILFLSF